MVNSLNVSKEMEMGENLEVQGAGKVPVFALGTGCLGHGPRNGGIRGLSAENLPHLICVAAKYVI